MCGLKVPIESPSIPQHLTYHYTYLQMTLQRHFECINACPVHALSGLFLLVAKIPHEIHPHQTAHPSACVK